jgi:DNA-binding NarL/FixJ family response regulator
LTRVLVADDEALMRAGLIELLSSDATIDIVGERRPDGRRSSARSACGRTWC